MHWLKRDRWKAGIAIAGMLLLLVLMVWVPGSVAGAYEGTSGLATPTTGTVQATPTVDPTMTALQKEQLTQQVKQLDNWWLYWLYNGSTAFIAAFATVIVALFGIYQWAGNRKKDLNAQVEERFKTAVTALGDVKESVQVGGAVLLRSFLHEEDKKSYGRYYTQIFDLAVAYLRLPRTPPLLEDPDEPSLLPEQSGTPQPLRQALVVVFKEAFPLARELTVKRQTLESSFFQRIKAQLKLEVWFDPQSLDASRIQLDSAYLVEADLKYAWITEASLRQANLNGAKLNGAKLNEADLRQADLIGVDLSKAMLLKVDLNGAKLIAADLSGATLTLADLRGADLRGANLRGANLRGTKCSGAYLNGVKLIEADLNGADLRGADLREADLSGTKCSGANFSGADLNGADLNGADLQGAKLIEATLSGVRNLEEAQILIGTNLYGVKGLTKEQKEACKAKGAIIDEDSIASSSQSTVSPSPPSQSNDAQAPSASPTQGSPPTPGTDGSSATSSRSSNGAQPPSAPPAQVNTPTSDTDGSNAASSKPDPGA